MARSYAAHPAGMPPTPAGAAPTLAAPDRDHDNGPVDLTALTPPQLQARRTMKWTTYPPDVLALWVAEMDYPTAEPVMAAIRAAVAAETFGYPMNPAASGLPEAYAGWALRRYGMTVDPADVHVVADVMHGVRLALEYFTAPDDAVIITTPVYMPFFDIVDLARRPQVHVPMTTGPDGRAALDLDRINAAFAAGARTLLLCSPYNPLGRAFSHAELAALAEVVDRHGGRVVSDEIHAPLVHDDRPHVPYASVSAAAAAHTLTVVAASKAWTSPASSAPRSSPPRRRTERPGRPSPCGISSASRPWGWRRPQRHTATASRGSLRCSPSSLPTARRCAAESPAGRGSASAAPRRPISPGSTSPSWG